MGNKTPNHPPLAMHIPDSYLCRAKFAEYIQKYQQAQGEEVHGFGVVKANPGQSKHLETATSKVLLAHCLIELQTLNP